MENCIIEVIKVIPSLLLTLFGIYLFLYYRKYLNTFIKYMLDFFYKSKIKSIKIGDTSFEFEINEFIYSKHNYEQDNLNKRLNIFNSYSIIKRAEFVIKNNVKINALWIDDNKLEIMPLNILTQLGINIEYVDSSEKALIKLQSNNKYDLILSDINRNNNYNEGTEFLIRLVECEDIIIPTIFYTSYMTWRYNKRTPLYAFGIAYEPYELLLLCLDVLERNIKKTDEV